MAILDATNVPASVDLLRTAAERCQQVGEVAAAATFRDRALALIEEAARRGETTDTVDHAATLITHARALAQKGEPDEALGLLEQAKTMLPPGREQAIALGDIARLRADKGEVDAALQLHQERLAVYEGLGDQDGIANTLWSIARIEVEQHKLNESAEHLAKSYDILLKIGRLDGICAMGQDFGQLLCAAGLRDAGLQILTRSRDGFQTLGRLDAAAQIQALQDQIAQSPPQLPADPNVAGP